MSYNYNSHNVNAILVIKLVSCFSRFTLYCTKLLFNQIPIVFQADLLSVQDGDQRRGGKATTHVQI